jgi:ribosomal protein S18 acetylase RimI-like enzyme
MYASPSSARPVPQRSQDFRISRATAAIVEVWPTGIGVSTMRDELTRAYAFMARGDMGGNRTVDSPYGRAVFTDEVPKRSDCNYLWVEREAKPEELVAEAQRLERRLIFVPDPELGAKLAPWFAEHGWRTDRHLVMAQLREPERTADLSLVSELDEEALRPARRRLLEGQPWATPEVVEQLFQAKSLIGERVTTRFFGVELDGEVVSYTDLYSNGADAQIEDVGTLPEHRSSGYATAVVLAAIETARASGADFVFLVADAEDWPKELYRRLGFDELGHYTKFFMPPA